MILINEPWMSYPDSGNLTRRYKYEMRMCPQCNNPTKIKSSYYKAKKPDVCKRCAIKNGNTKHGGAGEPLYNKWKDMVGRCHNPNMKNYKYYGEKGVSVCVEWHDYLTFKEWAETNGYEKHMVLDKDILCGKLDIHPKIYSPETCLFISPKENRAQQTKDNSKVCI